MSVLKTLCALPLAVVALSPDGPSQQCLDDAGPLWEDDAEFFGTNAYSTGTPASPVLPGGKCPSPLEGACQAKGAQRAYLEGPVDCGGKGWFCRIIDQPGWVNPFYSDRNFAHCNAADADERDNDGHCHGSDTDNVYGWWARDHWFRGYAGTLHCCCDWEGVKGLVNRCDYRKPVSPDERPSCRDANEEHNKGYEGTCGANQNIPFDDPIARGSDQCWTVMNFAEPGAVPNPSPSYPATLVAPALPVPTPRPDEEEGQVEDNNQEGGEEEEEAEDDEKEEEHGEDDGGESEEEEQGEEGEEGEEEDEGGEGEDEDHEHDGGEGVDEDHEHDGGEGVDEDHEHDGDGEDEEGEEYDDHEEFDDDEDQDEDEDWFGGFMHWFHNYFMRNNN